MLLSKDIYPGALVRILLALFLALPLLSATPRPRVLFTTSLGSFTVELAPDAAPKTVENFLGYVRSGHYKGTVFHRVIKDFMVQGGGFTEDLARKDTRSAVDNEADQAKAKGWTHKRGTLAMALPQNNPFGATAQFFINVKDNPSLDFKAKTMKDYGYCVFGKVVAGMDTVDKIRSVKTGLQKGMKDVPVKPVVITEAKELK
ncbi:MAG: peptidylprolyl isomerase [Acidobacteria bacterium]|nr:peptidylprolyl isomerase [Acidobacteriota bacterium]